MEFFIFAYFYSVSVIVTFTAMATWTVPKNLSFPLGGIIFRGFHQLCSLSTYYWTKFLCIKFTVYPLSKFIESQCVSDLLCIKKKNKFFTDSLRTIDVIALWQRGTEIVKCKQPFIHISLTVLIGSGMLEISSSIFFFRISFSLYLADFKDYIHTTDNISKMLLVGIAGLQNHLKTIDLDLDVDWLHMPCPIFLGLGPIFLGICRTCKLQFTNSCITNVLNLTLTFNVLSTMCRWLKLLIIKTQKKFELINSLARQKIKQWFIYS